VGLLSAGPQLVYRSHCNGTVRHAQGTARAKFNHYAVALELANSVSHNTRLSMMKRTARPGRIFGWWLFGRHDRATGGRNRSSLRQRAGCGFVRRDTGGRDVYFHRWVVEGAADADLAPRRCVLVAVEEDRRRRPWVTRNRRCARMRKVRGWAFLGCSGSNRVVRQARRH